MRRLFQLSRRSLATLVAGAIAVLTAGPVQAQYYPYPQQPGQPMAAPVMYVPAVAPQPTVIPVAGSALTGDCRSWGWGKRRECPPPCPAPEAAPAPEPKAPDVKPVPEPVRPPVPEPPPIAQPPVAMDQAGESELGPAVGGAGFALATPHMIGDATGSGNTSTVYLVQGQTTTVIPALGSTVTTPSQGSFLFAVPALARGPFKVAENESPRPVDRVFGYYNFYRIQTAVIDPLGTGDAYTHFDAHRETIGFEKTFNDGNCSIGMRLPFFQTGGARPFSASRDFLFDDDGTLLPATDFVTGTPNFDDSEIGDLTIVLKVVRYNDQLGGNLYSWGVVVTVPTGPGLDTVEGTIRDVLIQPWVGAIHSLSDRLYLHRFHSVAVPTESRDVIGLFNDVGIGYWLYRSNRDRLVTAVVPTFETHVNIPLSNRGSQNTPLGMADEVNVLGGASIILGRNSILSLAVGTALAGPQPFDLEGVAQFNYRF